MVSDFFLDTLSKISRNILALVEAPCDWA